jgi:hypothetical protein
MVGISSFVAIICSYQAIICSHEAINYSHEVLTCKTNKEVDETEEINFTILTIR